MGSALKDDNFQDDTFSFLKLGHSSPKSDFLVIPLLVLSSFSTTIIIIFEIVLICKAVKTTASRRHFFLSQVLNIGLFIGSLLGFLFTLEPNEITCVVIRVGVGFAYSLIFSSLLAKQVFLISLNTGVYLSAPYQTLLLLFSLLVQIVAEIEWITLVSPCNYTTQDLIFSLFYIIFLIIFTTFLAVKFRTINENFSESFYICMAMTFSVFIWSVWIISASIVSIELQNACLGNFRFINLLT